MADLVELGRGRFERQVTLEPAVYRCLVVSFRACVSQNRRRDRDMQAMKDNHERIEKDLRAQVTKVCAESRLGHAGVLANERSLQYSRNVEKMSYCRRCTIRACSRRFHQLGITLLVTVCVWSFSSWKRNSKRQKKGGVVHSSNSYKTL